MRSTELGYATTMVGNATHALEELVSGASRFDVVFSDVVMPGMTGIELAQEIRRRGFDVPIVLTSGYSHVLSEQGTTALSCCKNRIRSNSFRARCTRWRGGAGRATRRRRLPDLTASLRGAKRRSNPYFLAARWIASLRSQ